MSSQGRNRRNQNVKKNTMRRVPGSDSGAGNTSQHSSSSVAKMEEADQASMIAEWVVQRPGLLERPELLEVVRVISKSHKGPLPSPDDFALYEKALVGACDRILTMAEKQQDFVCEINRSQLKGEFRESRRGQLCAFLLGLMGMAACILTANNGADWRVSTSLGTGATALLIIPFLRRSKP